MCVSLTLGTRAQRGLLLSSRVSVSVTLHKLELSFGCQCVQAAHLLLTQLNDKLDTLTDSVSWPPQN